MFEKDSEIKTEEMILQNSKNLFVFHGLAWSLGRENLELFRLYFLQDIYLPKEDNAAAPLADVHEDVYKRQEKSNY